MSDVMRCGFPSAVECDEAVTRARDARLAAYRGSQALMHMTDAALQERLTGFPLPDPERANEGWWRVGTIVDQIEDKEYDVWYQPPVPRRLAVSERVRPTVEEKSPPAFVPDGLQALYRSRWEGNRS